MNSSEPIKVWDLLVRLSHWGLVATFCIAFLSEDSLMSLHIYTGYTLLSLLTLRLIWGVIGTKYARFSNFVKTPHEVKSYLISLFTGRAAYYTGHNPAGGLMIVIMMSSLLLTSLTGLGTHSLGFAENILEELHEFFANTTLIIIFIHIAGVLFSSLYHDENLIRAMINGTKQRHE